MKLVTNGPEPIAHDAGDIEVTPCPGGPLLVRGADAVRDRDGELHPTTRPVVAVCACEKSQRMPWCDGTHKVVRRRS
ncbi:MAG TPA: CDGSH iron-sulfur domain-containing protein [Nocardioidaceae bacterium]|nr:CDGSH iron-sulfur domain-containing protein [Nocardioidaceae bacterium]